MNNNIGMLIKQTLIDKGYTVKWFGEQMGKTPSEIDKMINGDYKFDLRNICKIEVILDIELITVIKHLPLIIILLIPKINHFNNHNKSLHFVSNQMIYKF